MVTFARIAASIALAGSLLVLASVPASPGIAATRVQALWAPSAKLFALQRDPRRIAIIDVRSGRERFSLGCEGRIATMAFSRDSRWLATAGERVCVFSLEDGTRVTDLPQPRLGGSDRLAFSKDGRVLALANDAVLELWAVERGRLQVDIARSRISSGPGTIQRLAFHPEGKLIATAGDAVNDADGAKLAALRIWSVSNGKSWDTLSAHAHSVRELAYAPDGSFLVSLDARGVMLLWPQGRAPSIALQSDATATTTAISSFALAPASDWIATGSANGGIRIHDRDGKPALRDFRLGRAPIVQLSFHPKRLWLAALDAHGRARVLDFGNNELLGTTTVRDAAEGGLSFLPDDSLGIVRSDGQLERLR